jgi:hypothetical protein
MDIRMTGRTVHRPLPAKQPLRRIGECPRGVSHRYALPFRHAPRNKMALGTGKLKMFSTQRKAGLFVTEVDIAPSACRMARRTTAGRGAMELLFVRILVAGFTPLNVSPAEPPGALGRDRLSRVANSTRDGKMFARQREPYALVQIGRIGGRGKALDGVAGLARPFVFPVGKLPRVGVWMAVGAA